MDENTTVTSQEKNVITTAIEEVLGSIEQEREKEIINRRFGLTDRKETLEHIGEMLGITRERVRQLEKVAMKKLRSMIENSHIDGLTNAEKVIIRDLAENGRIARLQHLTERVMHSKNNSTHQAHMAFIAEISPKLSYLQENDSYYPAVGIAEFGEPKKIKRHVSDIITVLKKNKKPLHVEQLHDMLDHEHPSHVNSLAKLSKVLASRNDNWGLAKWPSVNPKNIRDKIYVIMEESGKPVHFSEIAEKIRTSGLKRSNVTTQAIHNELIKDKRFILVGKGIYALDSWGYSKGTVADVITEVLSEAGKEMKKNEIIEKVLEKRDVKPSTVTLNLQNKDKFEKVSKNIYKLKTE